ncbi:unnamed protein product [Nesidiocoris tenuis]|uniref:Uncharacterized protein n=1 Tax=Nesidiocoris tenuis TaxID=355587 RepID=A0A6H5HBA7_9HEMI|nr:unnamed protein product [Nesidiocoris tenuis]
MVGTRRSRSSAVEICCCNAQFDREKIDGRNVLICVYIRYLQIESLATFKTPIGPRLSYNAISCREAEVCNHSHHETKPLRWAGRRYFALWRCICGLGHPIARGTILSDLMGSPLRPEWSRASGIAALPFTLMYIAEGRGSLKGWRATGARTRRSGRLCPPHRAASHMTNGPYSYASREAGPRG